MRKQEVHAVKNEWEIEFLFITRQQTLRNPSIITLNLS